MGRNGLLLACLALGCADISPIDEGLCGNEVLEPGEDCDVHSDAALGADLACGAPATPAECRYVCDASTCPWGWDCGADGICRRPSNELLTGPSTPDWSPASFEPVDFNGDGEIDLVGAFADRIEFRTGDSSGEFLGGFDAQTLPVTGAVSVGQLDSDPFGDILLPTPQGFLIWRGQEEGPPLPTAYGAIPIDSAESAWLVPIRHPDFGGEGMLAAVLSTPDGVRVALVNYEPYVIHSETTVGPGMTTDQLGGRVAVGDFNEDGKDELALGFRTSSEVRVYAIQKDLLNPGNKFNLGEPRAVDVGRPRGCARCSKTVPGAEIGSGVLVADVDADGHSDVLVGVTGPAFATDGVVVARGDGQGGFGEAYLDTRFQVLASPTTVPAGIPPGKASQWPIAAGDLNGDGIVDYVSPNGVFLTSSGESRALTQVYTRQTLQPYTAASLGDVDGDGTVDVIAIAEGEPFVDVLRGTGDGLFLWSRQPTTFGVTKVRTGHLRGPSLMDIALIENAPDDSGEEDVLSVMFGRPSDVPTAPIPQARVDVIEQLEIGRSRVPGWPTDEYEDVVISTRSDNKPACGFLFGSASQQLSSPFFLGPGFAIAERAVVGRFSADQAFDDLVLLGEGSGGFSGAWWVPGTEDAAFAPNDRPKDLRAAFEDPAFELGCARSAVGDVDGDGREEPIVVMGRAFCPDTYDSTRLAVGRQAGAEMVFELYDLVLVERADDGPSAAHMVVSDLDGDGHSDLVIARAESAQLFRGAPSGLELEASLFFELPAGEHVLDMTTFTRTQPLSGGTRVAVLTDASVISLSPDGSSARLATVSARGLRSADVDGDGLGDLLLLGDAGIDVLLTIPAPPLGGVP